MRSQGTYVRVSAFCLVLTLSFCTMICNSGNAFAAQATLATEKVDLGRNSIPDTGSAGRIAFVKPIFSDTAYSSAFYVFYAKYATSNQTYISTDLNLFNVTVKSGWGWSSGLNAFLSSDKAKQQILSLNATMATIDEINVTLGGLFRNGKRAYDVVILGFTEYVTLEEYFAYKEFVASGGTLIIMDACNFLAEVKYYPPALPNQPGYLSLLKGHGWEFNGTHAWKSVYARWPDENKNWVGGNYWHYWWGQHYDYLIANTSHPISTHLMSNYGENIDSQYWAHEENLLENLTNSEIIGYWHLINPSEQPESPIAAYQHRYINGSVIHSGIMASDKVSQEEFLQSFLISALRLALKGEVGNWQFPEDSPFQVSLKFCYPSGLALPSSEALMGLTYCYSILSNTIVNRSGVTYGLTSVSLLVYKEPADTPSGNPAFQHLVIEGNKTNASGLAWLMILDSSGWPEGIYAFRVSCKFSALINSLDQISQMSALIHRAVNNSTSLLRTGVVVALASSALVVGIAIAFFALDRKYGR